MATKIKISYIKVIFYPLFFSIATFIIVLANYATNLNKDVHVEYDRLKNSVQDSGKVLGALNYSFATHFDNQDTSSIKYISYYQDNMCRLDPKEKLIESAYRNDDKPTLALDFSIKGLASMCNPSNEIYQDATNKFKLAPIFSFLSRLDESINGLYYIAQNGYQLAAPASLNDKFKLDAFQVLKARDYWQQAKHGNNHIKLTGPHEDFVTKRKILTMSVGIYHGDIFKGILLLDISLTKLKDLTSPISSRIEFVESGKLPADAWMPYTLYIKGVETNQMMYFKWSWKSEILTFIKINTQALFGILALYFLSIVSLIYIKIDTERKHFQELSQRDPMTRLLNRRGLEVAYNRRKVKEYEGLAIFDIDDFKKVNDTFGHDKGDEVICYVAQLLHDNTRESDVVARFGGEEFVVYMQGTNHIKMVEAINRLQKSISNHSMNVLESGFTISGGLVIQKSNDGLSFEELLKNADDKLYVAKSSGKNQVVV